MTAPERHTQSASKQVVRPDVLAYVSPTTIRLVVLLGALLSAGLFMGTLVHNQSPVGDVWERRVVACNADYAVLTTGSSLTNVPEFRQCTAGVERRRAAFAVAGAVVAALGGVGVMVAAPRVIERRRRLRPAGSPLASTVVRFDALAREVGMTRAPALVVGSSTLRDAFSYGTPGRYRVALPPAVAVRWRDSGIFDPLVRHELAHVAHHDVAVAWLARSVWLVVVPLLALPFLAAALRGDFSVLPSYVWRAGLLAAVTLLASAALLRSREHDADLRAARSGEAAGDLRALLDRLSAPARTGWRRLLAYHPSAADRRAVLDEPARHAGVTFVDGLTAAFLAAVSFPLLKALVSTVTAGVSFGLSAAIVGPLLGATVGLGLWRQALVRRITGDPCSVAPAALGVLVGYGFGEAASLASTGLDSMTEYDRAALGALTALAASGATVVAAGLGELFADASARFPTGRAAWFSCVLLVAPLFAIGLWAATTLAAGFDWGGWSLASTLLVTILGTQTPAFVALLLAAASAWALLAARSGGTAPTWAVEAGEPPSWPTPDKPRLLGAIVVGIAAGTIGALVLACFRLLAGSGQPEQRYYLSLWLFAAVGAATGLALVAAHPARGLGVALLASPVASGTAAAGYVALNTALGGSTTLSFVEGLVTPGVALGLLLLLVVAVVSLAPRPQRRGPAGTLAAVAAGSVLAGGISLGVVAARDALVPVSAATEGSATGRGPQASSTAPAKSKSPEAKAYATVYAPAVERRMAAIERSCGLSGEATSSTTTESKLRLRVECLGPANSLLDEASGVRPSTTAVRAVHDQLLAALRSRLRTLRTSRQPAQDGRLGLYLHASPRRRHRRRRVVGLAGGGGSAVYR